MSATLDEFLTAADLDDLMSARQELGELTPADHERIAALLQSWQDPQAVANLLMYPDLIPAAQRGTVLLRGLRDKRVPYYVLAAVVGLQQLRPTDFSPDEADLLRERLFQLFTEFPGVIAQRASISLPGYVSRADTERLVELLNYPDEVVSHNALVMLIALVGLENIRNVIVRAAESGHLSPEALDFCSRQFAQVSELAGDAAGGRPFRRSNLSLPLLSYIPSLHETI